MLSVSRRQFRVGEWDGPGDGELGISETDEGVAATGLGRPVVVDQIGVRGGVLERLVTVADTTRHEHGGLRSEFECEHETE